MTATPAGPIEPNPLQRQLLALLPHRTGGLTTEQVWNLARDAGVDTATTDSLTVNGKPLPLVLRRMRREGWLLLKKDGDSPLVWVRTPSGTAALNNAQEATA